MNKQEAIESLQDVAQRVFYRTGSRSVHIDKIVELISQIDEPQKVVIPEFVAEWLKECKRSGWDLQMVLSRLDDDEKIGDWTYDENDDLIPEKVDMIARAWLDGFEIEQEKLYTVEIPNPNSKSYMNVLKRVVDGIIVATLCRPSTSYFKHKEFQLTEAEIKQDFEWAWDAGFAKPVEEK